MRFQSIHKFDGAVMLDLEAFGEHAHSGMGGSGQAFDGKKGLILLWFNSRGASGLLAEILEATHFVTELRERAVIKSPFCGSLQACRIIS